jgi:type II secretory pathway pseudopilin PulG
MNGNFSDTPAMDKRGFTYLGALILIVVCGISLSGASAYHKTIVKRSKEAELLFRGDQIRRALQSFYEHPPAGRAHTYPHSMQDLLRDPRYLGIRRHLRKNYADPMTSHGEWTFIRDSKGRIKGVFSPSQATPLKKGNFPTVYKHFEVSETPEIKSEISETSEARLFSEDDGVKKKPKYSDWKFIFLPKKVKKNAGQG